MCKQHLKSHSSHPDPYSGAIPKPPVSSDFIWVVSSGRRWLMSPQATGPIDYQTVEVPYSQGMKGGTSYTRRLPPSKFNISLLFPPAIISHFVGSRHSVQIKLVRGYGWLGERGGKSGFFFSHF